jgi:hypothetical protein
MLSTLVKRKKIAWKLSPAFVIVLCLCSVPWLQLVQAQTLQLRYTFEDTGTTTASDPSGALSVPLDLLNAAGAATDVHGAANSGVQNQGKALDFTATVETAGPTINGPIAQATNNTTLGTLGIVSNFTACIWFKEQTVITNASNVGPRLFIMGTNGVVDQGAGGATIAFWYQTTNVFYFRLNNSIISTPFYFNPLPTNVWLFAAVTYDGTNDAKIYFGTEASPAKLVSVRSIGQTNVNFGTSGSLMLGNRSNNRQRAFDGWLDEFRFYTGDASAAFVENIRQASTPLLVTGLYPDGMSLMQGTNTLAFNASSANGINTSGIRVAVNGVDVTPSLAIGGTANNRTVSYTSLPINSTLINNAPINTASFSIQVTDASGIVTSNKVTYDSFSSTNFVVEAEDYDFAVDPFSGPGGLFIDNPRYAFEAASDTYWQRQGQPPVDYNDGGGANQPHVYRGAFDLPATEFANGVGQNGGNSVGEMMRQKVLDALALNPAIRDVDLGFFDGGNWQNYTRTYPSGIYNVYGRLAAGADGRSATLGIVTSGWGTTTQTTNTLGTFTFANTGGWQSYSWVPLRDLNGNLVRVDLGGTTNTLRLMANSGGGGNQNFFMLVTANTNLPMINGIYPNGTNMFQPSATFSFNASSPAGVTINANSISVGLTVRTIQGVTTTNLTSTNGLTITGSATSRNVSLALITNATYTAVISVIDANGSPAGLTVSFDTYNPNFVWEGEDYNYNGGAYIDAPQTNGYAGLTGVAEIDYHDNVTVSQNGTPVYRTGDPVGLENCGDTPLRVQYIGTGFTEFDVGWYDGGNWNNYTRTLPSGDYNILLRAANGTTGNGGVTLSRVTSDPTQPNQTTLNLGSFTIPATGGWQTYTWVPMRDLNGNLVKFTGGGLQTLRATSSGGVNANFYALIPANTNLPTIGNIYPNGTNLFQGTNRLTFNVTSSAGVSQSSVIVTLDGVQLTNLTFSGSTAAWSVSYNNLQLNTNHTVVISATDINGNNATATVTFDTFPPGLFTWETEDYDYDTGQFIDNPPVDAYFGLNATADVDFHDANFGGVYTYRPNGTATGTTDSTRPQYAGTNDYIIGFFGANEWGNYTRTYPAGRYFVWGQFAAGGGESGAELSILTSGWGTTTQTTNALGNFTIPNSSWTTYIWVPMRNADGNLATVILNGSTNTLKLTRAATGPDVNVNFLMLVPAPLPGQTVLTAAISGANINLSFLTQIGFSYQVQYKDDLTSPTWTPLGSAVSGDGTLKTVIDSAGGQRRFYRLYIQ